MSYFPSVCKNMKADSLSDMPSLQLVVSYISWESVTGYLTHMESSSLAQLVLLSFFPFLWKNEKKKSWNYE